MPKDGHQCTECFRHFHSYQSLQRHVDDRHGAREVCNVCRAFEVPQSRMYLMRVHLKQKHQLGGTDWQEFTKTSTRTKRPVEIPSKMVTPATPTSGCTTPTSGATTPTSGITTPRAGSDTPTPSLGTPPNFTLDIPESLEEGPLDLTLNTILRGLLQPQGIIQLLWSSWKKRIQRRSAQRSR